MHNLPPHLAPQPQSLDQGMPLIQEQMPNEEEPQKILAHFEPEELASLDELQGGIVIDPETGLRDYTALDKVLKIPEINNEISAVLSQHRQKFAMGGEVTQEGRPTDPELEELRLQGRHGDTELAIITPGLLDKFSEWIGMEPKINPKTGLPEFGGVGSFFKSALRVVGSLFGPITGFVASKLTGQSTSAALKNAGIGAAMAAIPFVAPSIGSGIGSLFSGASGAGIGGTGGGIGGFFSNLFSPSIGGGMMSPHAVVGANTVGRMLPASAFGQSMAPMGMQAAGQTGGGGFLGSLLGGGGGGGGLMGGIGQALPLIGSGLLMAKGHREEQKGLRDYQRALEEKEKKEKAEAEAEKRRMGFYSELKPVEPYKRRQTNPVINEEEYARGITPYFFENYADGGHIKNKNYSQPIEGFAGGGFLSNAINGALARAVENARTSGAPIQSAGQSVKFDPSNPISIALARAIENVRSSGTPIQSAGQSVGFKPIQPLLNSVNTYRRRQTNPVINEEEYARGITPYFFENYAQGGAIRGIGKGQQDNIHQRIKENSYVLDASTVSDIGDGSSEAGIKELDHWIRQLPSYRGHHEAKGGYIDAMVSNDEYKIPPEKVTAIGHGSNKKGAQVLKKLVSQVRSQKRTSGNRLPPKAKPIGGYLKNMGNYAA